MTFIVRDGQLAFGKVTAKFPGSVDFLTFKMSMEPEVPPRRDSSDPSQKAVP